MNCCHLMGARPSGRGRTLSNRGMKFAAVHCNKLDHGMVAPGHLRPGRSSFRCRHDRYAPLATKFRVLPKCREWDGPAALPPPTAVRVCGGLARRRSTAMPRTTTVHAVTTIGIDMGKNTLHMIGLDSRGAIVLREKVSRGRITSRLANLPCCLIGIEAGMATHYVARSLPRWATT